ncbi:hypothetical protein Tco_0797038 [Tanacetum coccineum]
MRPTGIKRYIDLISGHKIKRTNRKCRIPIDFCPCEVIESMTMKKVGDQTIGVIRMRRIDKEGNVTREDQMNEFVPYLLPPQEGNMNGWLVEDANDSDFESTTSNQPHEHDDRRHC